MTLAWKAWICFFGLIDAKSNQRQPTTAGLWAFLVLVCLVVVIGARFLRAIFSYCVLQRYIVKSRRPTSLARLDFMQKRFEVRRQL